jgi:prepilin-type N-terminal cleavage/methylation domain-containing protein
MLNNMYKKGFTMIELLIVISILAVLSALIFPSLSKFRNDRILQNTTADIISLINKARSDTISSLNSTNYGVHLSTNSATYFVGSTYTNGVGSNVVVTFDATVNVPSTGGYSLNGGGGDIIFTRLTGDTTNYGTIILQLVSDTTKQKTITVTQTGSVSSN